MYSYIILVSLLVIIYIRYKPEGFDNKQPTVAILFAGRVKTYEYVYNKLEAIKLKYNPVAFCSINETATTGYINNFCDMFNIKEAQLNIEQTILPNWISDFVFENHIQTMNPLNMYSMFYHQNKAFKLLEKYQNDNNMIFDIVLYYRADLDSTDTLVLNTPTDNTVYIPSERDYFGVNDRMAYGNYLTMKKYCSVVEKMETIVIKENIINNNEYYSNLLNPEMILLHHLMNEKVNINKIDYNTDLYKFRNNKCTSFNECNA